MQAMCAMSTAIAEVATTAIHAAGICACRNPHESLLSGELIGFGIIYSEGIYGNGLHYLGSGGSVIEETGGSFSNPINYVHSLDNLAECGIIAVKMRCIFVHEEELASC